MKITPQYAFITDRSFLHPTLFSLWSLLKNSSFSSPIIHFWGSQLTETDWASVDLIMATCPNAILKKIDLDDNEMRDAAGPSASTHVTAATMARLFIPRKLEGRVLYIDGDTIVTSDLSDAFETDMKGYGVCQTCCPPISCGVSDFRGADFGFWVEPDGSGGLPVAGFA